MTEYLQVWRAKVADDAADRLLAVRPAAIAEAQRLCPELLRADLVRLGDGTWLDVLTWSCADGEERLMGRAEEFDALHSMHELLEDAERSVAARSFRLPGDRTCSPTPSTSTNWPAARPTATAKRCQPCSARSSTRCTGWRCASSATPRTPRTPARRS